MMKNPDDCLKGVRRLEHLPEGWRLIEGISSPKGWRWANNGKSRFGKEREYEHALVRDHRCE